MPRAWSGERIDMAFHNEYLFAYEHLALLEALRRDLKTQRELADRPGRWAEWHRYNARMVKRLLDAINPKRRATDAGEKIPCEPVHAVHASRPVTYAEDAIVSHL
jgi:hypothetical protein